jgi:hypothetical protein
LITTAGSDPWWRDRAAGAAAGTRTDLADVYGARTVDTNSPVWWETATMDEDLGHPNEAGYAALDRRDRRRSPFRVYQHAILVHRGVVAPMDEPFAVW